MALTIYTRYRTETLQFAVADSGAVSGGEALIASKLRPMALGRTSPDPASADVATLVVTYRAADSVNPVGWLLTLDAATCATIPAGNYAMDVKITDASGNVTITSPALVQLMEPATL